MRKVIIYLTIKYKGNWQDIYNAIKRKEKPDSDFEEIINGLNNDFYITTSLYESGVLYEKIDINSLVNIICLF